MPIRFAYHREMQNIAAAKSMRLCGQFVERSASNSSISQVQLVAEQEFSDRQTDPFRQL